MPITLNAMARYHYYDRLFTIGKFTKDEILGKLWDEKRISIKKRTFEGDIAHMRKQYNAPIDSSAPNYHYRYKYPFSITSLPLTEPEKEELALATAVFARYAGFQKLEQLSADVADVTIKMMSHLGSDNNINDYVEFDRARGEGGIRFLIDIYNAIKAKRPLRILHKRNDRPEPKGYDIHPYRLKEYLKTWYVLAFDDEDKKLKVFGLDRIISIEKLDNFKLNPPPPDITNYFEHIVGVKKPAGIAPQEVVVRCKNYKGAYFQAQPLHKSQQLVERSPDGDEMIFKYILIPNEEFYGEIGRWGEDVEIVNAGE